MVKTKAQAPSADVLKKQDEGYQLATKDAVKYLAGRGAAVGSLARRYYLDADELGQEAYEVLLTCLRDYTPVFIKDDGTEVTVQFNTFFGSRLETRAMEMRNRDPEYQARQAMTEQMTAEEKEQFRNDPPLLVQHLDHETTLQEQLRGEISEAYEDMSDDAAFKILRDSFFDQKLAELVARESDEKKQAALLHVKVGGVYNFNEIAYHFGVTDSRASQVMNELMDAFYVQRLIDRDLKSVQIDFQKLKFNDKRVLRLLAETFQNVDDKRAAEVIKTFQPDFAKEDLDALYKKSKQAQANKKERKLRSSAAGGRSPALQPPAYDKIFTDKENKDYPLLEVGLRPISSLKELDLEFRSPEPPETFKDFVESFEAGSPQFPAIVSEDGFIIDGLRRIKAAKAKGRTDYLCLTRKITTEEDKKRLRVVVNMRLHSASKTEMYFAISALSDMGYSQQKIADCLGTSRTNVLVYCKVRDKASPRLRGLFEDELMQVTNASACADLTEEQQERIVVFIRRYGPQWSKGKKFNKLYDAVLEGKEDKLVDATDRALHPAEPTTTPVSNEVADPKIGALQKQLETYAIALKDQEIWAAQREGVINQQREELSDIRGEAEALRRELEAAELIKFGNPKAMEQEMKQLREFLAVSERLAAATNGIQRAGKEISRLEIRRKQAVELTQLSENLEKALNTLRLELHNACRALRHTSESEG